MKIYKLKNIILGIGMGIVFSSLININVQSKSITEEYIKKEAIKKGLIVIDPKDIINKNGDLSNSNDLSKKDNSIEIYIENGSSPLDIATTLLVNGLIDNKQEFINYIKDNNKTLNTGRFYIEKDFSIEQIINIIAD